MRFKNTSNTPNTPAPTPGQRRVQTVFLALPRTIGDETRWLEEATILQEARAASDPLRPWLPEVVRWIDVEWVTPESTR